MLAITATKDIIQVKPNSQQAFFLNIYFKLLFSVGRHACYSVHVVRGQVVGVKFHRVGSRDQLHVGYLNLLSHLTAPWV